MSNIDTETPKPGVITQQAIDRLRMVNPQLAAQLEQDLRDEKKRADAQQRLRDVQAGVMPPPTGPENRPSGVQTDIPPDTGVKVATVTPGIKVDPGTVSAQQTARSKISTATYIQPIPADKRINDTARLLYGKGFDDLNPFEKAVAAEQAQNIYDFTPETMPPVVKFGISMMPIGGTMYFWDQMEPWQKGVSIAGDVLFFTAPYLFKGLKLGWQSMTKGSKLIDPLTDGLQATTKQIKKLAPELYEPFKKVTDAQLRYADDLVAQAELRTAISETEKALSGLAKGTKQYDLLDDILKQSRVKLKNVTAGLPKNADELAKAFDDWKVASKAEKQIQDDIVKYTESVIDDLTSGGNKQKLLSLQDDLKKAKTALDKVKNKYKTDPARWDPEVREVAKLETEIKALQAADAQAIHSKLIAARQLKPAIDATLKTMPKNNPYYDDLVKLSNQLDDLPKQLDDALNELETIWKRAPDIEQGGKVGIKAPPGTGKILSGGGIGAATKTAGGTLSVTRLISMLNGMTVPETSKDDETKPTIIPDTKGFPGPDSKPGETKPDEKKKDKTKETTRVVSAGKAAPGASGTVKTSGTTGGKPEISGSSKTASTTETETETEPATQTETSTAVKTKTSTATKTTTPTKTRPVPVFRQDTPAEDKRKRAVIQNAAGAIAWRQGKLGKKDVWHVITSPYTRQENLLTVVGPSPKGATLARGPRSAYKTAQTLYGHRISRPVTIDVGFIDARLSPVGGKKAVRLSFKPDPKLLTKSDLTISKGRKFPLK